MEQKIRKSLGSKRKKLSDDPIAEITCIFGQFAEASDGKVPMGKLDPNLRNTENVPLREDVEVNFKT